MLAVGVADAKVSGTCYFEARGAKREVIVIRKAAQLITLVVSCVCCAISAKPTYQGEILF